MLPSLAYIQAEFLNKMHNVLSNLLKFINKVSFFCGRKTEYSN